MSMETDQLHEKADNIKEKVEDITDHISDLAQTYYKLAVLNASQKASVIASSAIAAILLTVLALLVILFGSFTLAWWLGSILRNNVAGFGIVTGFYFLLSILIITLRKKVIFPYFRNLIIRKLYD